MKRRYRLYFNRAESAPQVWSVDEGSTKSEINVQNLIIQAHAKGYFNQDAEYPEPKAWLEVVASLTIQAGNAVLKG